MYFMGKEQLIIYCDCAWYDIISEDVKGPVLESLKDGGARFVAVADLCKMAAKKDPVLKEWAKADSVKIAACFPRAIRCLFDFAGAKLSEDAVIYNMRTQTGEEIILGLGGNADTQGSPEDISLEKEGDWVPWFPVIDYGRCVNCKQCLNFCLFGVYGVSADGKVAVVKPDGCKTNCPACARVCPEGAIIFPKYADGPINGDAVDEEALKAGKVDLSGLTRGEILDKIRNRGKGRRRFSADAKSTDGEKLAHLNNLQDQLGIPQDVLDSLAKGDRQHE